MSRLRKTWSKLRAARISASYLAIRKFSFGHLRAATGAAAVSEQVGRMKRLPAPVGWPLRLRRCGADNPEFPVPPRIRTRSRQGRECRFAAQQTPAHKHPQDVFEYHQNFS